MTDDNTDNTLYDLLGIGAGPFNLSVAALTESTSINSIFVERKEKCEWHPGMQIEGAKIQNSHLRDLVSLADPTNKYSFTNFLHKTGRLEVHLIANFSNILRKEFEQYMHWVTEELGSVHFSHEIKAINKRSYGFEVLAIDNKNKQLMTYKTKSIVVGAGSKPIVPAFARNGLGKNVFHNSSYSHNKKSIQGARVSIIGAGQSGLEVMLDLMNSHTPPSKITLIDKQPFISQIEDSQFAENVVFSAAGVEKVFDMNANSKKVAIEQYRVTSDGASLDTIQTLYQKIYTNELLSENKIDVSILHNAEAIKASKLYNDSISISLNDQVTSDVVEHNTDILICATGYKQAFPVDLFSAEIIKNISFSEEGLPEVGSEYALSYKGEGNIYVVNGAKHTHGVVDPNLSLNAIRAAKIINHKLGNDFFEFNNRYIYKDFSKQSPVTPDFETKRELERA